MGWKGVLVVGAVLLLGGGDASAEIITIDKELPQLMELRKAYETELKTAATPDDLAKIQEEYEQAKKNLAKAEGYAQKLSTLEEAKKKEIEAINAKYLKEQEKVDVATRKGIDEKYEKKIAELKNRSVAKTSSSYQGKLEKLEKELVGKNDLAGALVVQYERKKLSGAPAVSTLPAAASPAAPVVAAASSSAAPGAKGNQVHVNSARGLAGTDVQAISADISNQVKQPGQYRVEFQYTDGDEAFNIYRVEIQSL